MSKLRIGLVSFACKSESKVGLISHVRELTFSLSAMDYSVFVHCVNNDPSLPPFESSSWYEGPIHVQEFNYAYHDIRSLLDFQRGPQSEVILTEWAHRLNFHIVDIHHTLFIGLRLIAVLADIVPVIVTFIITGQLTPAANCSTTSTRIFSP